MCVRERGQLEGLRGVSVGFHAPQAAGWGWGWEVVFAVVCVVRANVPSLWGGSRRTCRSLEAAVREGPWSIDGRASAQGCAIPSPRRDPFLLTRDRLLRSFPRTEPRGKRQPSSAGLPVGIATREAGHCGEIPRPANRGQPRVGRWVPSLALRLRATYLSVCSG